ncbi:hypothetical protein [Phytohabitans kaempferiae]|uniref:Chaplin domain-containing protein n=1 Tax=Phytohabitans kaempferiae TaxID=1620943 RepID=A0ABV6M5Z6_9ACTN
MRIKTIVGLSFAGAAAAVAVAGGVAYAADDAGGAGTTVKIVESGTAVDENCPDKNGGNAPAKGDL